MTTLPVLTEAPRAVERAAQASREREAELREAEAALEAAQQNVQAARQQDIEAAALAREHGQADPPDSFEQAARRALDDAGRERDVRGARARMAGERLEELLAEHAPDWQARVEKEWAKTDAALRRKLAEVEAALGRRAELTIARAWLRAVQRGEDGERALRKARAPAAQIGLPDLQELRAEIDSGSVEAWATRVERAERELRVIQERDQEEYEQRLAEARAERERLESQPERLEADR
jgi:hypothetical protein